MGYFHTAKEKPLKLHVYSSVLAQNFGWLCLLKQEVVIDSGKRIIYGH